MVQTFSCVNCNYSTSNKYDWRKHLHTRKHGKNTALANGGGKTSTNVKMSNHEMKFSCGRCQKSYKTRGGLFKHERQCMVGDYHDFDLDRDIINTQSKQLQDLQLLLEKSLDHNQQTLNTLVPKIGTNTTNNINNKMTINLFLNEKCKDAMNLTEFVEKLQLSLDDLCYTRVNGYSKGIANIFVKNLQELKPTERPIHCSDKKRLQFYIKDENKWEKDKEHNKIDESIEHIACKQINAIKAWEKVHPNWSQSDSETNVYMEMVKQVLRSKDTNEDIKKKTLEKIKKELGSSFDINKILIK